MNKCNLTKLSGVYQIKNTINNKIYIGSSKDIERRWKEHKKQLNKENHHSYKLQRDWTEFGEDKFIFEIIDKVNEDQLKEYEQYWLDTLIPYKIGYNILPYADIESNKTDIQKWNDENGGFIFSLFRYNNCLFNGIPDLIQEDIFKIFYISIYLNYDNYLSINKKDMNNLLEMSRERFGQFFNRIKNLNIILQEGKLLKINIQYLSKGVLSKYTKQYNDFTRIYINSIKFLYENCSISKHSPIGALLKLIPYIHRENNILCWNQIDDISEIKIIKKTNLDNILEYHRNGTSRLLKYLNNICLNNGESIIKLVDKNIIVNPRIVYGGSFKNGMIDSFIS